VTSRQAREANTITDNNNKAHKYAGTRRNVWNGGNRSRVQSSEWRAAITAVDGYECQFGDGDMATDDWNTGTALGSGDGGEATSVPDWGFRRGLGAVTLAQVRTGARQLKC
jgi:hypothetical protein